MSVADLKRASSVEADNQQPTKRMRADVLPDLKRARSPSPSSDRSAKRPPIMPLQPSQRLGLFRKKQKWRMSSLYAARQIDSSRPAMKALTVPHSSTNQVMYGDVGVQTDEVPELQSKAVTTRENSKQEAEKKVAGVFSAQFLYDLDEIEEKPKSPVKFPSQKKLIDADISEGSLTGLMAQKRHVQTAKAEVTQSSTNSPVLAKDDDVKVGPSAGFTFMKKAHLEEADEEITVPQSQPKKKFSFGSDLNQTSTPSLGPSKVDDKIANTFSFGSTSEKPAEKSADKPSFSFGQKPEEKKDEDKSEPKPSFSFGGSALPISTDKPAFSFGQAEKKAEDTIKPAISFGVSTAEKPSSGSNSKKEENLSFAFGAKPNDKPVSSAGFTFGAKSDENSATSTSTGFSFGAKTDDKKEATPALSLFGSKPDDQASKPAFSFGTTTNNQSTSEAKPAFNFGGSSTESKPATIFGGSSAPEKKDDKPAFKFGAATEDKAASKPSFSFGSTTGINDAPKPSVGLGSTTTEKPAFGSSAPAESKQFSFGDAPPSTSTDPKPFSFGNAPSSTSTEPKPFSFGSTTPAEKTDAPSAFNFGAPTTDTTSKPSTFNFGATSKTEEPKSVFGAAGSSLFGASARSTNDEQPPKKTAFGSSSTDKPAFSFGSTSTPATEKPAFSFGSTTQPAEPKPSFNFGAKPADSKPSFNFGAPAAPPSSVFGQSSTPSFGFGQTSTPAPGASAFGQVSAAPAFGFGSSTPSQQSPAPAGFGGFKAPALNTGSVNFNFASSAPADPASVFSGTAPQNPPGGFSGFGTPALGASGAPAFGTPAGTPTGGQPRRIAQPRARRRR